MPAEHFLSEHITRPDGGIDYYRLATPQFTLVLSPEGVQKLGENPQFLADVGSYMEAVGSKDAESPLRRTFADAERKHLVTPEGTIYQLKDSPYLIKEINLGNNRLRLAGGLEPEKLFALEKEFTNRIALAQYQQQLLSRSKEELQLPAYTDAHVDIPLGILVTYEKGLFGKRIGHIGILLNKVEGIRLDRLQVGAMHPHPTKPFPVSNEQFQRSHNLVEQVRRVLRNHRTSLPKKFPYEFKPRDIGRDIGEESNIMITISPEDYHITLTLLDV